MTSEKTAQWKRIANGVEIVTGASRVQVQYYTDGIVRVTKQLPDFSGGKPSLILVAQPDAKLAIASAEDHGVLTLTSKQLKTVVSLATGEVSYFDATGSAVLKEAAPAVITPIKIEHESNALSVQQDFKLSADEGIYGLGQHQLGEMNYRGRAVKLVQSNTQSANPFLVSTRGYGILWDNYSKTIFTDTDRSCAVWSEVADGVDYYFVYGGNMDGAIAGYRLLTGQAPLYGRWAYGYWQSKEHYENRAEVLKVAAEYRSRQIPIDGIVQDWDYWDGRDNWNQLYFEPKLFPNPSEMLDILHSENFHFMISIWCGFGPKTAVYQEMEKRGFLYPTVGWANFKYFDAYNPEATDLYWKYVKSGLYSKGVDGWWMDSTEPDIVNAITKESEEYEMKRTGMNHLGSFARYLNTYPLFATEAVYKNQRKETDRKRVYILTRSTFAGQQRAAATTWSGDIGASWEIYQHQITAGLNHSMSGIPYWTFDIGAFVLGSYGGVFWDGGKVPAYQELYTRMFQFGSFCPIFRSHGSETPREIWEFGTFTDSLIKFDKLRYRLMPYIYSNAWKTTNEGYTPMRGLPMDFPQDQKTYGIKDEFMFGPAILVCPVTEYMLNRPPELSVPVTPEHFKTDDGQPGLKATYYGDDHFGTEIHTQIEPSVALYWYTGWPSFIKSEKFSMRWEGKFTPSETGAHRFQFKSFGPRTLILDGKEIKFTYTSVEAVTEPVELVAGREYKFSLATGNSVLGAFRAQLYWKTPSQFKLERQVENRPQTRAVYLPANCQWIDFWTGQSFEGGQTIQSDAPIDKIPLFVRAGSILPMGPVVQYAAEKLDAPIELRVYRGANGEYSLYDDENDNYDYEKGVHATVRFNWDDAGKKLTIAKREGAYPGMPKERVFNVVLVDAQHGIGPEVNRDASRVVQYNGDAQVVTF